ncbi:hypothetical protein [Aliiroseovarius marinus]|uniref:hypothetical protein n=1 Tax=Aliiroseovarius marinus TaxID=2500159 RepID=UPI00105D639B|nr:hypothetical protein [Aliiroseovarius marinus]
MNTLPQNWMPLGVFQKLYFQRALKRQMAPGHVLQGRRFRAVAKDASSDDVLYILDDGQAAVVHLTWTKETSAAWPSTALYPSLSDFVMAIGDEAEADPVTHYCPECGSNWSANEAGTDCETCGGYALFRPCSVCGGACGAIWERAVLDSIDAREPVFVGSCKQSQENA